MIEFPPDFSWGTATAAYQVEGAVEEDGRGPSIWDTFTHLPGTILNGDTGDVATDHYHRYREDAAVLGDIGAEYYRFSVAWPRIFPTGSGAPNVAGIDFYKRLLDELEKNGVRPWLTLYHWDLPQALQDVGGWPNRDTAYRFADYAEYVHDQLGDRVQHWTTLNEPFCSAFYGYASGVQAPGIQSPAQAVAAGHHLLLAHGLAVQRLRPAAKKDTQFGITLNLSPTVAASDHVRDLVAARRIDGRKNRFFLDPLFTGRYSADLLVELGQFGLRDQIVEGDLGVISQDLDFLGVNYYRRFVVRDADRGPSAESMSDDEAPTLGAVTPYVGCDDIQFVPSGLPRSSMGWEIDPDGLHQLLTRISAQWQLPPLFITENGMALYDQVTPEGEVDDAERISFMVAHLEAARQAIHDGVDLRGYFAWSSFDNFEWALGLEKRFGLVHVDYDTLVRTPKRSAAWYREVARTGEVREVPLASQPSAAAGRH